MQMFILLYLVMLQLMGDEEEIFIELKQDRFFVKCMNSVIHQLKLFM